MLSSNRCGSLEGQEGASSYIKYIYNRVDARAREIRKRS